MQIIEVINKKDNRDFIDFPKTLYIDDPCWVCPLDAGIDSVFNPKRNPTFKHGKAIRWVLKNSESKTIGRIAAFIDFNRSAANSQPTGGIGYFEVIKDRNAAFCLFDTVKEWLVSNGMSAMDGPINFGENDNNWGLLVEGFVQQAYGMPYNKEYYKEFFEEYGFKNYFEQYSYHRDVRDKDDKMVLFPERIMKIAEWLVKRPGYSFHHFELKNKDKYVNDIVNIYNSTWSVFKDDFTPLDPQFLNESLEEAKSIIDEDIIWFAYHNDNPIAFFVLFPDLNQILKHLNGNMNIWTKIKFLYLKKVNTMTRMRAVVGGVHPAYQNSGVESAIFLKLYEALKIKPWYNEIELSWVGDYNPKMLAIYQALGAVKAKTHLTYRFMIDNNCKFIRYKDEMVEKQNLKNNK
jgi:hypothetical protein